MIRRNLRLLAACAAALVVTYLVVLGAWTVAMQWGWSA